ncbi:MAG: phosphate/phosphite/phosphonate ABC transporter substrate-binding protein [Planctomycetes bacterium]|nr:phosphate/phosphite/phosphonate ABC transporter substrate-binding protein [Planctomycetota bacterium]MCH9726393.1 phosphate/phosphite/phosphonate ABC transporter substrate-binding protein [Planctomycetota bacterium]MCH9779178.1 phosphate/phosphite/phosphonate ABC transporter substrate-binding protein [Planctomycetota bacterium]
MTFKQNSFLLMSLTVCLFLSVTPAFTGEKTPSIEGNQQSLSLIVMDPLAAPLSCPCVKGYAQRKYEKLGEYLEKSLGYKVNLVFSESLAKAIQDDERENSYLIIGKDSVVRSDSKKLKMKVKAIGRLSDLKGETTQTGLIVVPAKDPAQAAKDLSGYRILLGPSDCDEKHLAALAILKNANVKLPEKLEISSACSDGACKILEFGKDVRAAAIISSYAKPLLQGCGTIKKGDLRVVAETKPVPFITAFASGNLTPTERRELTSTLMNVGQNPELCVALESLVGFVPPENSSQVSKQNKVVDVKKK